MQKLLITASIFTEALLKKDPSAIKFLNFASKTPYIQGWILADTIEKLIQSGVATKDIIRTTSLFTTIPIGYQLNKLALESKKKYQTALYEAAAKEFKISFIISQDSSFRFPILNCSQALKIKEDLSKIDFMDLKSYLHPISNTLDGWNMEIIQNTAFSGGNHTINFEKEFAAYCETKYASAVSSGTAALKLSLIALGVGDGDEVITTPNTFIATTEVISQLNAKIVFVDILPTTYNMDPEQLKLKITDKTKAIIPVHLYGHPADMDPILKIAKKFKLKVLEDASQAQGAIYNNKKIGSLGDAAAFSLYPSKNLGAFGEAGVVTSNNKSIIEKINLLKNHGQKKQYSYYQEGYNARMDNLQGAVLRSKLIFLDEWNQQREKIASCYNSILKNCHKIVLPTISKNCQHAFYAYPILINEVKKLANYLTKKNIEVKTNYSAPLHLEPAYTYRKEKKNSYPIAESYYTKLIFLPIHPALGLAKAEKIAKTILQFYSS